MRINNNYAYICIMKTRLNLTIDNNLLTHIKAYASSKQMSVSELVENYFKNISKSTKRKKNIISLVDKLEKPAIEENADLKELFYKEQAKKYGF